MKRTKIICTLGPSTNSVEKIIELIHAGMDVARLNFSHGSRDDHKARIEMVRKAASLTGKQIAILQDLQGPKIRIGDLEKTVLLKQGERFTITTEDIVGTYNRVSTTYKEIVKDVRPGDRILMDDGLLEVRVVDKTDTDVITEIVIGGLLKSKKGLNLPGVNMSVPSLSEKDVQDVHFGLDNNVDLIALSFVRSAQDIDDLRQIINMRRKDTWIVAKIERPEAIANLESIVEATNAVMVARGDLGVEMKTSSVPILQKRIVQVCNAKYKPVIIATQMLESMTENPRPTRAEASDVANAVFDGTDAVMLSGETASGKYPIEAVRTMSEIIANVESSENYSLLAKERYALAHNISESAKVDLSEAIAVSAVDVANTVRAKAIVVLSHTGSTAIKVSKQKPRTPIVVITDNEAVQRRMNLVWGVQTIYTETLTSTDESFKAIEQRLMERGLVQRDDVIVYTMGIPILKHGTTDTIKVSRVGA
ncbi:MAG: pyruvate kinase [Chloroherpetonaceae bacterium]|nr:pyruvate kinase [Chloroherpetonaceae bacterium]MDW8437134.1 pyruvate kinase [Chloroherpetonaceae bacterium]